MTGDLEQRIDDVRRALDGLQRQACQETDAPYQALSTTLAELDVVCEGLQEKNEQLREVDRWKDALLAAAAHDIRSPVAVISTDAEMLVEDPDLDGAEVKSLAMRIGCQAKRLASLVDDLLDLDRLTRGSVVAERHATEVRGLAERVVTTIDAREHSIEVVGQAVTADLEEARVAQIVQNLVLNAVQHTPPGTPIRVEVGGDSDRVTITVEDEGPGIPPEVRPDLLVPFVTAASHDGDRGGTGIGLSLVDLFAQLHGGGMRVEDRPGGGARFVVELPGRDHTA